MMTPRVCFVGLYQNASQITTDAGIPIGINILGLSSNIVSTIYPLGLGGMGIVLAIFNPKSSEKLKLVFKNVENNDSFYITFEMTTETHGEVDPLKVGAGWFPIIGRAPEQALVTRPGQFAIFVNIDGEKEEFIGYLAFQEAVPPPLTEATVEAIKADPMASKAVRFSLKCNKCGAELRTYTALSRSQQSESDGWIWQTDLPDTFTCSCGATSIPLKYLKQGLHGLLRRNPRRGDLLTAMTALYEVSALEQYCLEFRQLLEKKPDNEAVLQSFLEEHKIFLHRFAATQIITKPPILSKFNADFIILNNRKELLLIEIEKSTISLLKKAKNSFGVTADLQHAIDQVRSWRQIFDDFRDDDLISDVVESIRHINAS